MEHIETYPHFKVGMGTMIPKEGGLALVDEMPLFLLSKDGWHGRGFSLEEAKAGAIETYLDGFAKGEILEAYVGPSMSFTSCPLDEKEARELLKKHPGAVKGGEGRYYYLDCKVLAVLALRKAGIEATSINVSPLTIDEATGILTATPKAEGSNVYRVIAP